MPAKSLFAPSARATGSPAPEPSRRALKKAPRVRPPSDAPDLAEESAASLAAGGTLRRWVDTLSGSFRHPRHWAHTVWADTQPQDEAARNPWGTTVLDDSPHGSGGRH
jgi:hypothetical protein